MSFFSGFTTYNYDRIYETSFSEAIATTSNIGLSLFCIFTTFKFAKIKYTIVNIIFFILFMIILVIYYINKNEKIKVYEKNADDNLNKIYFTSSIVSAVLFIIIITLI